MEWTETRSRRQFLSVIPAVWLGAVFPHRPAPAPPACRDQGGEHPEPRPGIDASKVLKPDRLSNAAAAPVYDKIREIPEVADGIRCHCGCAELPGYYSLLTCFEEEGMAQFCEICQGEAKLVHSLHSKGNSLAQIRAAIDAFYG